MDLFEYYNINYAHNLPSNKEAKILDFGCGSGITLRYLQNRGYNNLNGVDIKSYETWGEMSDKGINLTMFGDITTYLETIKSCYDFIILKDVLYYFTEDTVVQNTTLLKEALNVGGKMLFDIINGSVITGSFTMNKDLDIRIVLTEHSLVTIIERSGLRVDSLYEDRIVISGLRSGLYFWANLLHKLNLKVIYFSERGVDSQNPKILSKKIIAIASVI